MKRVVRFGRGLIAVVCLTAGCGGRHSLEPLPRSVSEPRAAKVETLAEHEWWLPVAQNCRLYVREIGQGPYVIVLHDGWGLEHSYLVDGFRPLAKRFRFVFYDQRGSLRSPCDSLASIADHVDDLDRLRAALGQERVILVGHTMGAFLAASYAMEHPDRVAGLALLGGGPIVRSTDYRELTHTDLQLRYRRPEVLAEMAKQGLRPEQPTDPRLRWLQYRIAKGAALLHNVGRWEMLEGTLFYASGANRAAAASMPKEWDFTSFIAGLPFPVLVVFPDDDLWPPPFKSLHNADVEIMAGAGHVMWVDQPQVFTRILSRYLRALTPTAAAR
jgi:proline iminopeptidase